jgi:uncharacterized alpha-E superfamily protein
MNRYIERAENVARFVDVNLNLMLDLPVGVTQQWEPLVQITGDVDIFRDFSYGEATAEKVIQFLSFDANYSNSILSCLRVARENARSVKEIISSEMWEEINTFYLMVRDTAALPPQTLSDFFYQVKMRSHLFAGVMDATMTHNEGWHFGKMGRLLERADKTARILDVKYFLLLPSIEWVGTALDQIQWIALLKSASAYEMYRKFQHRINPSNVAEFLILDRQFPRSIHSCLKQSENCLHEISGTTTGSWSNAAERALGKICSRLGYLTIEDVIQTGLHEFLDQMEIEINEVGNKIADTFFATSLV